jgi:rfaE bifunctional protein nucleotidyltransferase chain/domain
VQSYRGDKVVDLPALLRIRDLSRRTGRSLVWTNGCFDLLHAGHVLSLQAAARLGDVLVVGINGDPSVRRLKGAGRPVLPEGDRATIVAALECVDHVLIFHDATPAAVLYRLRPDVHCKGADYAPPRGKPIPERAVVEAYGGRVEFLPLIRGISTTELIRRLQALGREQAHGEY